MIGPLLVVLVTPAHGRAASGRAPVIVLPGLGGSEFTANTAFSLSVDNGHGGTFSRNYGAGEQVWVNTFQRRSRRIRNHSGVGAGDQAAKPTHVIDRSAAGVVAGEQAAKPTHVSYPSAAGVAGDGSLRAAILALGLGVL